MSTNLNPDIRNWAMWCHLSALAQFVTLIPIPFVGLVAPLVIWSIKKDEHPFIDASGKEALNFQIAVIIYSFVIFPVATLFLVLLMLAIPPLLGALLAGAGGGVAGAYGSFIALYLVVCFGLFPFLWGCLGIFAFVVIMIAGIRANQGQIYHYPFTWRFLK